MVPIRAAKARAELKWRTSVWRGSASARQRAPAVSGEAATRWGDGMQASLPQKAVGDRHPLGMYPMAG